MYVDDKYQLGPRLCRRISGSTRRLHRLDHGQIHVGKVTRSIDLLTYVGSIVFQRIILCVTPLLLYRLHGDEMTKPTSLYVDAEIP